MLFVGTFMLLLPSEGSLTEVDPASEAIAMYPPYCSGTFKISAAMENVSHAK